MAKRLDRPHSTRLLLAIVGGGIAALSFLLVLREAGTGEGSTAHATVTCFAAVVGGVLLSWLILWTVRWRMSHPDLTPLNDVMGFVYSTIGVVYSVIFAFVVVTTWQQFEDVRALEDAESHAVADLYRLLPGLPESEQEQARATLTEYVQTAIEVEWPQMADGDTTGTATLALIDRMWQIYGDAQSGPTAQGELYSDGLERLAELGGIRRERLHASEHGIPGMLWFALIIGALVTVGFAAGFRVESWVVHAWLVAALAALVSLFLLVTIELDRPYAGDIRVAPEQFRAVQEQFAPESVVEGELSLQRLTLEVWRGQLPAYSGADRRGHMPRRARGWRIPVDRTNPARTVASRGPRPDGGAGN